jgi:hypothetical protein
MDDKTEQKKDQSVVIAMLFFSILFLCVIYPPWPFLIVLLIAFLVVALIKAPISIVVLSIPFLAVFGPRVVLRPSVQDWLHQNSYNRLILIVVSGMTIFGLTFFSLRWSYASLIQVNLIEIMETPKWQIEWRESTSSFELTDADRSEIEELSQPIFIELSLRYLTPPLMDCYSANNRVCHWSDQAEQWYGSDTSLATLWILMSSLLPVVVCTSLVWFYSGTD